MALAPATRTAVPAMAGPMPPARREAGRPPQSHQMGVVLHDGTTSPIRVLVWPGASEVTLEVEERAGTGAELGWGERTGR